MFGSKEEQALIRSYFSKAAAIFPRRPYAERGKVFQMFSVFYEEAGYLQTNARIQPLRWRQLLFFLLTTAFTALLFFVTFTFFTLFIWHVITPFGKNQMFLNPSVAQKIFASGNNP